MYFSELAVIRNPLAREFLFMTKFGKENNMRKLYEKKELLFAVLSLNMTKRE